MGKFTMQDDPRVDEKIRKDLDHIVAEILATMSPITVILAGSFGRGEGSVLFRDDSIAKVKDYDIVIVAKDTTLLHPEKLRDLRDRIEARCGFSEIEAQYKLGKNHVELLQFSPGRFLVNTHQMVCDFKRTGMVLYGKDIRGNSEHDLQKLALSSVYYRMLKNMKILLNTFSINYLASPPVGMERFSLIFFCSKVYMSMERQLRLCQEVLHPSSGIWDMKFEEAYKYLYPELAIQVPDLPGRIREAADLRFFPDRIETSAIDPVGMWFETQRDLDQVMQYCLGILAHADSDEWKVLSNGFYQSLCRDYHLYQAEHILDKRFGIRRPWISALGNIMYRMSDSHRYFMHLVRKKKIRPDLYALSPVFKILAISPLFLFSLRHDGQVDRKLFSDFCGELSSLFPGLGKEIREPSANNWEILRTMLLGEIGTVNRILNP